MSARELREIVLFRGLDEAALERLASLGRPDTVRRGDVLFRERDPAERIYAVLSGVVEVGRAGRDGRFLRLARVERGELFGEWPLLEGDANTATAQAAVAPETRVYSWERSAFRRLLEEETPLARALLLGLGRLLARRLRGASEALAALVRSLE